MTQGSPSDPVKTPAFYPEDRHKDGGPRNGYWWARRHGGRETGEPWWPEIVQVNREYHYEFVPTYRNWEGRAYVLEIGSKRKWALSRFDLLERLPKMPEHLEVAHRELERRAREVEAARDRAEELPKAVLV